MDGYISKRVAHRLIDNREYDLSNPIQKDLFHNAVNNLPSADVQILSRLLAELTHKERTDRYHVWTTNEVKQWIADKITEMKNDG